MLDQASSPNNERDLKRIVTVIMNRWVMDTILRATVALARISGIHSEQAEKHWPYLMLIIMQVYAVENSCIGDTHHVE
jgi:hypothetical protein